MDNFILNEIKGMEGTLLGIGLYNEKFKTAINKNKEITICNLLEEPQKGFCKKNFKVSDSTKTINIKKLRKFFHKKKIDNIICNFKTIKPFLKAFIKNSVYINRHTLYIYGDKKEIKKLICKYKRYTEQIKIEEYNSKAVLVVDNTKTKIKEIDYNSIDTINWIIYCLTDIFRWLNII